MSNIFHMKKLFTRLFKKENIPTFFKCILYTLFFALGLNLLGLSQIFLSAIIAVFIIKMILCREFRINLGLLLVVLFCICFSLSYFAWFGISIKRIFYYLVFPIGTFLVGSNLMAIHKEKPKVVLNVLLSISLGFCLYSSLNMVLRIFMFGLYSTNRYAIDIWDGGIVAATGVGSMLTMISAFLFPILLVKSSYKKWYHILFALLGIAASLYITLFLSNRGTLLIMIACFILGIIVFIMGSKKRKIMLIYFGSAIGLFVAAVICFYLNVFKIRNILQSIPFFERIAGDNIWDLFGGGRINLIILFFENFIYFPFGGGKMPMGDEYYFHNVWFDTYNLVGLLPCLIFIMLTAYFISRIIFIILFEKDSFLKILLCLFASALLLLFLIEPILHGSIYIYTLLFLCFGLVNSLAVKHKSTTQIPYKKKITSLSDAKIVYIVDSLSTSQIRLCEELYAFYGVGFHFVASKIETESNYENLPYLVEMTKDKAKAMEIIEESDIIINDCTSTDLEKKQKGKITFRCSERIYKSGKKWEYLLPQNVFLQWRHFKRFEKEQFYILCTSAYFPLDAKLFDFSASRCFRWGDFVNVNKYETADEILEKKANLERIEMISVNKQISWLQSEKCLLVANYLVEQKISFRLRIIGSGAEAEIDRLQKRIKERHLEEYVIFLGKKEDMEVMNIMEESHILLAFSSFQDDGKSYINEGMKAACVVVASHLHESAVYLVDSLKNGIIYDYGNDTDLRAKVLCLCENKELIFELGKNAFLTMKNTWNAKIAVERFNVIVERIISNKAREKCFFDNGPLANANVIGDVVGSESLLAIRNEKKAYPKEKKIIKIWELFGKIINQITNIARTVNGDE